MLIEYQIEITGGGAMITQRIKLGNANSATTQQSSGETKPQTQPGKVSVLDLPGSFDVQQLPPASTKSKSGGGDHDSAGTGGGGAGSGLVIVFGPVVVMPSGGAGSGGGDHDPAGIGGGE